MEANGLDLLVQTVQERLLQCRNGFFRSEQRKLVDC